MSDPTKKIREYLDKQEEIREELLDTSHEIIRNCSSATADLHRMDLEKVSEKLEKIGKKIEKLNKILSSEPQFRDHGSAIAAHREYAEIILTRAIIRGEKLPDPEKINVLYKAYAQALAESTGELRRYFLNQLCENEVEKAQTTYKDMEKIFDLLEQFDYPDSILPGMRHRRDVARQTLEKTRADITRATRERRLEKALNKTESKLEDLK